jgi:hypothetical protein
MWFIVFISFVFSLRFLYPLFRKRFQKQYEKQKGYVAQLTARRVLHTFFPPDLPTPVRALPPCSAAFHPPSPPTLSPTTHRQRFFPSELTNDYPRGDIASKKPLPKSVIQELKSLSPKEIDGILRYVPLWVRSPDFSAPPWIQAAIEELFSAFEKQVRAVRSMGTMPKRRLVSASHSGLCVPRVPPPPSSCPPQAPPPPLPPSYPSLLSYHISHA